MMTRRLMLGTALAGVLSVSAAMAQDVTWKLSHTLDPQSIYHKAAEKFKEEVEANSDGAIEVNIFHSGQLGWEREVLEAMQLGTVEATIPSLGPFANFVPAYNVFNLPFTFQSADHMLAAYELDSMGQLTDAAEEKGFVVATHFLPTFRYPLNAKRAIATPADFDGLKMRTMGVPAHIDTYNALGANVQSMPFSEVYGALQLGAVDGVENYYNNLYTMKFQEQTSHISNIPILNNAAAFVFSKQAFDALNDAHKKVVMDAAKAAGALGNEIAKDEEDAALQKLQDEGITLTQVEDLEPFIALTEPVSQQYLSEMEPWVAELRQEIMDLASTMEE